MFVVKDTGNILNSSLVVDNQKVEYKENTATGKDDLIETYCGQFPVENTHEQKYLGFVLSSKGDNMANISQVKNKSIGLVRKIVNCLDSLKLQKYYFECYFNEQYASALSIVCIRYEL